MDFFLLDFSLIAWLASRSIPSVKDISVPQASKLLMELGLDHFLDTTDRCSLSDTVYRAAGANGWMNGYIQFSINVYVYAKAKLIFITAHNCNKKICSNS